MKTRFRERRIAPANASFAISQMTDLLFTDPGNPAPENAAAGFFVTGDGKKLRYALFRTAARPLRGTVILLQGRNEFIEKYFETVRDLATAGFDVATFDLRGQGLSDRLLKNRRRGHVRRFDDYVGDLERFMANIVLPDCAGPFYILAHSTGGLIALLAAPALTNSIVRMVLSAPLLGIYGIRTASIRRLSRFMRLIGAGSLPLTRERRSEPADSFSKNILTSDPARFARNCAIATAHPELALGAPTARWLNATCLAAERVQQGEFAAKIHIPTLFIAAGADRVVSTPAIEAYSRRLRSGSLMVIDGARHEILQEADLYREQFLAAFKAFLPQDEASLST
jgi:lysophospholipase